MAKSGRVAISISVALHILQDSTSPSHSGFQECSEEESASEVYDHVKRELINPGAGSDLDAITRKAWEGYKIRGHECIQN